MKKELYICDGLPGLACGTVLVEDDHGFVLTGKLLTAVTGAAQTALIDLPEGEKERCLCRQCFLVAIGVTIGTPKGG